MLTANLVRARRQGSELRISELNSKLKQRALELSQDFVALAEAHVGQTRAELSEAFASIEVGSSEHKLALGLRKLVEDRLVFEMESEHDPRVLRSEIFTVAAATFESPVPSLATKVMVRVVVLGEAAVLL